MAVLNVVHMDSIFSKPVDRNESLAVAIEDLKPSKSALFHKKIFLRRVWGGRSGEMCRIELCHSHFSVRLVAMACI